MPEETRKAMEAASREAHALGEQVAQLTEEFHAARIQNRLLRRLVRGIACMALLGLVGGSVFGFFVWNQQRQMTRYLQEGVASRASIALIRDCIDPQGACYKRSQQRTAAAVAGITDANHDGRVDTQEILDVLKKLEAKGAR